jgi:hypothetical protein
MIKIAWIFDRYATMRVFVSFITKHFEAKKRRDDKIIISTSKYVQVYLSYTFYFNFSFLLEIIYSTYNLKIYQKESIPL